jgi:hypothetical protein
LGVHEFGEFGAAANGIVMHSFSVLRNRSAVRRMSRIRKDPVYRQCQFNVAERQEYCFDLSKFFLPNHSISDHMISICQNGNDSRQELKDIPPQR